MEPPAGFPEEDDYPSFEEPFDGPNEDDMAMEEAMFGEEDDLMPPPARLPAEPAERGAEHERHEVCGGAYPPSEARIAETADEASTRGDDEAPAAVAGFGSSEQPTARTIFSVSSEGRTCTVRQLAPRRREKLSLGAACFGRSISAMIDAVDRENCAAAKRPPPPRRADSEAAPAPVGLWVDRYAPRSFTQLLSDERQNRAVLRWVKGWDAHVFGIRTSAARRNAPPPRSGNLPHSGDWQNEPPARDSARPERPLLLLSGPPGLGKTTLVHVVARHAGYRVLEINASDERSGRVIKQRVKEASEAQTVYAGDRPVLILLDEIDGAMSGAEGSGAIGELLKLASPVNGGNGLNRPVICVCNDLYAPALRPLRAFAELCEFKASASNTQLALRLRSICEREGLRTDEHTLSKLCERADGDVRTCINTLQFVRANAEAFSIEDLQTLPIGKKDVSKGPMALWKEIFVLPHSKAPNKAAGAGRQLKLLDELARTERANVVDGVAENYLSVGYADPQLSRTADAAEWLSVHDEMLSRQFSKGQFALLPYLDWPVLGAAHLCAVAQLREPLRFPKTASEQRTKFGRRDAMLRGWRAALAPSLFNRYSRQTLVTELLSPLLQALAPPLRGGTSLNSEERQLVLSLVDHHIAFGLRYQQMQAEDGTFALRLDPPIIELLPTEPQETAGKLQKTLARELPAHARTLLASELHRQQLRRQHAALGDAYGGGAAKALSKAKQPLASANAFASAAAKGAAKAPSSRGEAVRYDMFGRPLKMIGARKRSHGEHEAQQGSAEAIQQTVRYKFHEGVTDAIRRTVRIRDLF